MKKAELKPLNTNPVRMILDRVHLDWEPATGEHMEGGVVVPARSVKELRESAPKYIWLKVLAVGPSCQMVKVGDEVLIFEAMIQQAVVPGSLEKPICYTMETQIICARDAVVEKKDTGVSKGAFERGT